MLTVSRTSHRQFTSRRSYHSRPSARILLGNRLGVSVSRHVPSILAVFFALAALPIAAEQSSPPQKPVSTQAQTPAPTGQKPAIAQALETQVLLDREGFSPGEIDGVAGANTTRAMNALKSAGRTLPGEAGEIVVPYVITEADVAGPFTETIPAELPDQAKLPALGYTSPLEALGERFHSSPALVQKLNPGFKFAAGETIFVPNILPRPTDAGLSSAAPPAGAPSNPSGAANVRIVVSKSASTLTVFDDKNKVIFSAPVTSGSQHDPLPLGKWTVTTVSRRPTFHYNPDLFWDADPSHAKAKIPPGPNNPVGLVWIDISKPHYGLHGTPNPGKVGHADSHGCVRLTNWDALHVASLVQKGTAVVFER